VALQYLSIYFALSLWHFSVLQHAQKTYINSLRVHAYRQKRIVRNNAHVKTFTDRRMSANSQKLFTYFLGKENLQKQVTELE